LADLVDKALATLLISLRIAPALAFAPPFTLLRVPAPVRLFLALALAGWLVAGHPAETWQATDWRAGLPAAAVAELMMGIALGLALQLAFAALLTAGRALDLQAGFGFASMIDPATRAQAPLIGTLFAYAAAAIFFLTSGPADLLALWAATVEQVPLGGGHAGAGIGLLAAYVSAVFVMAFGAGGLAMLVLFLIDLAIAFISRTLPQMNVLMLGFQVKTLATLVLLPPALMVSASLFLRMLRFALESAPRLM